MMAFTPWDAARSGPSRKGKKASEASTEPCGASARLLNGDADRVEPAHLASADADQLTILREDDRVRFTEAQTRQAKSRSLRSWSLGARSVATWPAAGSGSIESHVWTSRPPSMRRRSKPAGPTASGASGDPTSSRRTLFRQVGLVVSQSRASW